MCFAKQPEPDINKPAYPVDDIDKNIKLTETDKNGKTTDINQPDPKTGGQAAKEGPVLAQTGGIRMR